MAVLIYRSTARETLTSGKVQPWTRKSFYSQIYDLHTALNVALFPPLYFFSALYYTDVASTAAVLLTLVLARRRHFSSSQATRKLLLTAMVATSFLIQGHVVFVLSAPLIFYVFCGFLDSGSNRLDTFRRWFSMGDSSTKKMIWLVGLISLTFRQTNVFWVAIFPAGIALAEFARGRNLADDFISKFVHRYIGPTGTHDIPVQYASLSGM